MKYICWDTESLFPKPQEMGWADYKKVAGISVACTMTETGSPAFWTVSDNATHDILALTELLESSNAVVSYNGRQYDNVVLAHILGRAPEFRHDIDLYAEIRRSLNGEYWPKGSWKLDRVATDTLGLSKTGEGAMAPTLWNAGHMGELFTYVYMDVHICRMLFEHILKYEWVLKPNGEKLPVYLDL